MTNTSLTCLALIKKSGHSSHR